MKGDLHLRKPYSYNKNEQIKRNDRCEVSAQREKKGEIDMKKTNMVLTFLAVAWLVCYALIFLANVIMFPTSFTSARDFATQPMVAELNTIVKVSASSNAALNPAIEQTKMPDLFTRPLIPASLGSIIFGLWAYCGIELSRLGYRGVPPIRK
jgi:hypothetical protein